MHISFGIRPFELEDFFRMIEQGQLDITKCNYIDVLLASLQNKFQHFEVTADLAYVLPGLLTKEVIQQLKEIKTKYGVLDTDGKNIVGIREKPSFKFKISAGINIINPDILSYIKPNSYFDMPDLINRCIKSKKRILCYEIKEYWKAIDRIEDLGQAYSEKKKNQLKKLISKIRL